jgi:uncharacterized protein involved in exopolysaccharide biosynthesis
MTAAGELLAPELDVRSRTARSPLAELGPEAQAVDRPYLVIKLVWEHRRFIARSVALGTLLSLLIALLLPGRYESRTELMPPDPQSSAMATQAALIPGSGWAGGRGLAADLLGAHNSGALFIDILRSHTVQNHLINRFDLRRVYGVKTYLRAREKLDSLTNVSEGKKSGVLTITVSDHDPRRAAAMVQAYVEELNAVMADLNTSAAHRERVFLEQRLQVVKQELDRSAREVSHFSSQNATIDFEEQGRSMIAAAANVQGQIITAEAELRDLEQSYSVRNIRVRSIQARVAELEQQLQKLGGSASAPDRASDYPSLRQLPVLGVAYADRYRQFTINESVYRALSMEYETARVQEAKEIPCVKVVDPADLPETRAGPACALITVAGAFLSLFVAGVWLFARQALENTSARDPRKALAVEILAAVGQRAHWAPGPRTFRKNSSTPLPPRFLIQPPTPPRDRAE